METWNTKCLSQTHFLSVNKSLWWKTINKENCLFKLQLLTNKQTRFTERKKISRYVQSPLNRCKRRVVICSSNGFELKSTWERCFESRTAWIKPTPNFKVDMRRGITWQSPLGVGVQPAGVPRVYVSLRDDSQTIRAKPNKHMPGQSQSYKINSILN